MRKLLPVATAVGLIFSNQANAAGFDFSFSNETANLEILAPINSLIETGSMLSLGVFYNKLDDLVFHGKVMAVGQQTNTRIPYQLSLGAKAYVGEIKEVESDVGAISIGGSINIQFSDGYNPLDFTIEGFFAPGITTFRDTESIFEVSSRLSIEIVPQAKAFIGYRQIKVEDTNNVTREIEDNVHIGIRLLF